MVANWHAENTPSVVREEQTIPRTSGGTRTVMLNEFTRYLAWVSTSTIPFSYSRAWKRVSCYRVGKSVNRAPPRESDRKVVDVRKEPTNMIDVTCSRRVCNSWLITDPPPGGLMSSIEDAKGRHIWHLASGHLIQYTIGSL